MLPTSRDTIAATATPPGRGGVGIIRLSGPASLAILTRLAPGWPTAHPSHTLRLTHLIHPDGLLIDHALAVWMQAPRTYTGEEVVELHCHGGPHILERALDACLQLGARAARPGEFTERAFLNGRLDLTQAEAVADLINASSAQAHRLALEHLEGRLGSAIGAELEALAQVAVLIEAALDFSHEEHVYQIERDAIDQRLTRVLSALTELERTFDRGRRQREGLRAVIVGEVNAGKSSLFNALHGSERAIVTPVAGTTRDFLEEQIALGGALLRLVDTAGLRETDDAVEAIGIQRSRAQRAQADVLLWVIDRARPMSDDARAELAAQLAEPRALVVVCNKADRPDGLNAADRDLLARVPYVAQTSLVGDDPQGLDALATLLERLSAELGAGEGVALSRARHLACVRAAIEAVARGQEALALGYDHELIAIDVREAMDALGELVGRISADDILNRIFGEFCVGK